MVAAIGLVSIALILSTFPKRDATTLPEGSSAIPATAQEVAAGFLEAFGAFDAERAVTYLADDADLSGLIGSVPAGLPGTPESVRSLTSWLEAERFSQALDPCEPDRLALETTVRCPFEFHALGSYEIGRGPYRGSYYEVTVRDGKVVRAVTHWDFAKFSPQMWEPFDRWVSTAFPNDVAVMYTTVSHSQPRLTEESIRLWQQRSRGYLKHEIPKVVGIAERFLRARNAYDAGKAMSMLADDGARVRLMHNNRMTSMMGSIRLDRHELALALEAERLYGVRYGSFACRSNDDPVHTGEARIECSYLMDSTLRQIAGLPPKQSSFAVQVHNGRITSLSFPWLNLSFPGNEPAEGWRFEQWLEAEHPEAGGPMEPGTIFRTQGQEMMLILTGDSLDHLADYLAEYERVPSA